MILSSYGFKRITPENVTALDNQPAHLFRRRKNWLHDCLKPQLQPCVPEEVAFLYEVARGSMVYGMFFQPLASLATEQFYRVLEAGARQRCSQLGLLKKEKGKKKVLPNTSLKEIVSALKKGAQSLFVILMYGKQYRFPEIAIRIQTLKQSSRTDFR